jgi:hypothetical protein
VSDGKYHQSTGRNISQDVLYRNYSFLGVATTQHLHPELSYLTGIQETGLTIQKGGGAGTPTLLAEIYPYFK